MTIERQDIDEDFYESNTKEIEVVVWQDSSKTVKENLTDAECTYSLYAERDPYTIKILKSSTDGGITIDDPTNGHCIIHLLPADSVGLNGTWRHQLNVVTSNGDESTAFVGKVKILISRSIRPRASVKHVYLEGASS